MKSMRRLGVVLLAAASYAAAADPFFLRRDIAKVGARPDDLTANGKGASYKPLFGIGDQEEGKLVGVARYGELTLDSGGASAVVSYPREEQIYFILDGEGTLLYGEEKVPVKKNDFMYLPVGLRHGMANSSGGALRVIVIGHKIPAGEEVVPTAKLQLASADDVGLQVLSGHGPTTQFKLLMGTTASRRDKLAAAHLMNSLFIMDFAPGGTNIPHSHRGEEEIYLVLRGTGEIVAGQDASGNDARHPVSPGAAFYYAPGTRVGYYSNAKDGQEHDLILAVRSRVPGMAMGGPGPGNRRPEAAGAGK